MKTGTQLSPSLFLLRRVVAVIMLVWSLDKFFNPRHAAAVYEAFYLPADPGGNTVVAIGAVGIFIVAAFFLVAMKRFYCDAVLMRHALSPFSSHKQYLVPCPSPNMLFFAARAMRTANEALYLLRGRDAFFTVAKSCNRKPRRRNACQKRISV